MKTNRPHCHRSFVRLRKTGPREGTERTRGGGDGGCRPQAPAEASVPQDAEGHNSPKGGDKKISKAGFNELDSGTVSPNLGQRRELIPLALGHTLQ